MGERYAMLVFSNPLAGAEETYVEGYKNRHIAEVVAVDGVDSGRFFAVESAGDLPQPWGYVARYELADEPGVVLERIYAANASGELEVPEWIIDVGAWIFNTDSDAADWVTVDTPTALFLGDVETPGAARSRRLSDAGHPFDPSYPSPWPVVTDAQFDSGIEGENAVVLAPLSAYVTT